MSDYRKVKSFELEIADVIYNLETLSGNPLGNKFNKTAVLKHLNTARVELNIASLLASATKERTKVLSFEHIVKCREYLQRAKGLMAS